MSRDPYEQDTDPAGGPPSPEPPGRMRTTGPGVVVGAALLGLVLGWLLRPAAMMLGMTAPRVGWLQAAALYLVAAIVGVLARATHRALQQRRHRLEPHEAVNRLVLAKACAIAGSLVAGGYLGYALSWVGLRAELAGERIQWSLVAAGGAALTVVVSLLLERACRVRDDDPGA